ncbi:MAG: hypothetical protein AAFZ07_05190 [Actinomycetota bacterium]
MRRPIALLAIAVLLAACGTEDRSSSATTAVGPSESSTTTAAPQETTVTTAAPADDTTPTTAPEVAPRLPPPTGARFADRDTAPFILESTGVSPDGELVVGVGPAGGLCRASTQRPDVVDWCADIETEDLFGIRWGPGGEVLVGVSEQGWTVVDAAGELTQLPSVAGDLDWSPDGTRLIGVEQDLDLEAFEVLRSELVIIDVADGSVERTGIDTIEWMNHLRWLDDDLVVVVGRTELPGTPRIDLVDLSAGSTVRSREYPEVRMLGPEDLDVGRGVLLFATDEGLALYDVDTGDLTVVPDPVVDGSTIGMYDSELAPGGAALLAFGNYRNADDRFRLALGTVAIDLEAGTVGEWELLQVWPGDEPIRPHDGGDSLRWVDGELAFAVTDGSRTLIEIELTR